MRTSSYRVYILTNNLQSRTTNNYLYNTDNIDNRFLIDRHDGLHSRHPVYLLQASRKVS